MKRHLSSLLLLLTVGFATYAGPTYSLQQIVDSAICNNNAVRSARLNVEASQLQRKEARTKYFPTVSASAFAFDAKDGLAEMELNLAKNISPELAQQLAGLLPPELLAALGTPLSITMMENGVVVGVTAVQPIFVGGRIINGNKLAGVGEDVSRLQLQMSEKEVERTAENYFWQIVTLEEKRKTIESAEQLLNDIHKDVTVALDAGVILKNDLLQVQLRQNELESQKIKLNNGIALLRMLLAQYCGFSSTDFALSYSLDAPKPSSVARDHQLALLKTPEYNLLSKQVEATDLQRKMELGKNLPSVAVGVGYTFNNILNKNHTSPMVFATLNVPITDWWGGSMAVKRKKIEWQQAVNQLDDNSQLLKIKMQKALNDVEEAYTQISLAQRSVEQSSENLRIQRNCYHAGTITMSNLLEAQMLYQQAVDKRVETIAAYQNALLEYRHSVGE